ncbi:hypothetical protein GmHk_16G046518 [Glycine max]|nr:hypothetical protein GmHk_16G046518 [Glycine max]
MEKLEARVQCLLRLQQADKAKYDATWKIRLEKEAKQKADAEARHKTNVKRKKAEAKAEKTRPSKLVSKPIVVTAETTKMAKSTPIPTAEMPKDKENVAPTESTLHEATSIKATVVTVHTTIYGPTPINFSPPEVMTKAKVKEMIGLAMDSFAEKQRASNEEFRQTMQQAISIYSKKKDQSTQ